MQADVVSTSSYADHSMHSFIKSPSSVITSVMPGQQAITNSSVPLLMLHTCILIQISTLVRCCRLQEQSENLAKQLQFHLLRSYVTEGDLLSMISWFATQLNHIGRFAERRQRASCSSDRPHVDFMHLRFVCFVVQGSEGQETKQTRIGCH